MKTIKPIAIAILLIALLTLSFTACGNGQQDASAPPAQQEQPAPAPTQPDEGTSQPGEDAPQTAVAAPFTPEQSELIDRVCDALLAEEYEYALLLMETPEMLHLISMHGPDFLYRDQFYFSWYMAEWGDGVVHVTADKTQNGTGLVVEIRAFARPWDGHYFSEIEILEHKDGVPNGIYEWREYESPGAQLVELYKAQLLNGYYHGEQVLYHSGFQGPHGGGFLGDESMSVSNFEYGFIVPFGPPNERGRIPHSAIVNPATGEIEEYSYHAGVGPGFTEPRTMSSRLFEQWLDPLVPRYQQNPVPVI